MKRCAAFVVLLAAAAGLPAQSDDLLARLVDPASRTRAAIELRHLGAAGATRLVDALARDGCPAPEVLAEELAALGPAAAGELGRLVALVPSHAEPVRTWLLRAVANAALTAADETAVDTLRGVYSSWANDGWYYSEQPEAPTFAWQEYVRLRRRLALRGNAASPVALFQRLVRTRADRSMFAKALTDANNEYRTHDLNAFGDHSIREDLEAVAELAMVHGEGARQVVAELAPYLACETPRPGTVLREGTAGIGENAPNDLAGAKWPTLWRRDEWRFATARAVAAQPPDDAVRDHALRHLLLAPAAAERIATLARVRELPQPWSAFAPELRAMLDDTDRLVVREALITWGLAQGLEVPTEALQRIAAGAERELAALAKKLLR